MVELSSWSFEPIGFRHVKQRAKDRGAFKPSPRLDVVRRRRRGLEDEASPRKSRDPETLRPATQLITADRCVRDLIETSEELFLTQAIFTDTIELAEARFKGDDPGFIYSRFAIPTVSMFEQRMASSTGRGGARRPRAGWPR